MKTILSFASALLIIRLSLLCAQSALPTMKAMVAHQWGGPEALKFEDVPTPAPKENEMPIKVFAAGVNSFDGTLLTGKYAKMLEKADTRHARGKIVLKVRDEPK